MSRLLLRALARLRLAWCGVLGSPVIEIVSAASMAIFAKASPAGAVVDATA
ncbi:hypothetical protein M877_08610 [Streptomyces niveus NCIMB 11891]|nr:hypothetical protein M877_08610 [Streptomyces niveus NCIMB 11891]